MTIIKVEYDTENPLSSIVNNLRSQAKKEVFDDIVKMLKEWNCQDNPKMRTTINTAMMRIGELQQRHLPNSASQSFGESLISVKRESADSQNLPHDLSTNKEEANFS